MIRPIAAIIGGGVIGGGWAARFLLAGWDVKVFDPDPEAERKISEVLDNARSAVPQLIDKPLPEEGQLIFAETLNEAVRTARWIQESVPERLDMKQVVYKEIQAACRPDAIIGSSTSGFKPSELNEGASRPGQIVVTHPYNPVYLLPLVELVAPQDTTPEQLLQAQDILSIIGMKPVHIKGEIEAHVGDRLLEAVWREALWLIKDGIATTQEIDDIMTHSFGLRWAQMGLFETYRVAGGEAGMRHFISQFGPALAWPWTKLMDVPELDDALIDKIARQSDAQSGSYSIRELERIRDRNLIGFLQVLKRHNWGAGAFLNEREASIPKPPDAPIADLHKPLQIYTAEVLPAWIDYNGHMTEFRYLQAFSEATDAFLGAIGLDDAYLARGFTYFTVETHLRHLGEAKRGEALSVETQILMATEKKIHIMHQMRNAADDIIATSEHMILHVNNAEGKSCPAEPEIWNKLEPLAKAHEALSVPDFIGRYTGQRA